MQRLFLLAPDWFTLTRVHDDFTLVQNELFVGGPGPEGEDPSQDFGQTAWAQVVGGDAATRRFEQGPGMEFHFVDLDYLGVPSLATAATFVPFLTPLQYFYSLALI